ncbi:sirohydrochlorin chelatase [Solibacillus sp. FSL H8-0538]|uniref:sirohydrochlorin chelatase n=1 Tax=Solibacillus sp. FSL H8-0538 TaxID=2921400 RepID=UPI0030F4FC33
MIAVLYIAHGSRVKKGVEEAKQFLQQTIAQVDVPIQEISFLELAEPTILQGIEKCVARGAKKIAVSPILLLTANHLNQDIPKEIAIAQKQFPHIEITVGKAFGIDDRIVESLYERLQQTNQSFSNSKVLLIGRGSSDLAVQRDLTTIAHCLKKRANLKQVDTCFLYGAGASFEETIQALQKQEQEPIFIIPYLLFTGLLKASIEKKIAAIQKDNEAIVLCECLGYDLNVQRVLIERVYETIA